MKQLFLPYELAVLAKEKGFSSPCLTYYFIGNSYGDGSPKTPSLQEVGAEVGNHNQFKSHISAPLYQQILDWFREYHNVHITIDKDWHEGDFLGYESTIETDDGFENMATVPSYYESLDNAIKHSFKYID